MPQTKRDLLKVALRQSDHHLFTAIDRLFHVYQEFYKDHKLEARDLLAIMNHIELSRFMIMQWYGNQWGGRPGWFVDGAEAATRLREQRLEWLAWDIAEGVEEL